MYNQQQQFIVKQNYNERMDTFADRLKYYLRTSGHKTVDLQRMLDAYGMSLPYPIHTSYAAVMAHKAGRYQPIGARLAIYSAVTGLPEAWWAGYGTRAIRTFH